VAPGLDGDLFDRVLDMVRAVAALDMEAAAHSACHESQAKRLKDAGLTAYNHNLDTSPRILRQHHHHPRFTKSACRPSLTCARPDHRLAARDSRYGESDEDRVGLLHELSCVSPAFAENFARDSRTAEFSSLAPAFIICKKTSRC